MKINPISKRHDENSDSASSPSDAADQTSNLSPVKTLVSQINCYRSSTLANKS